MAGFNTDFILQKISEMEDGEYSMSDIFVEGDLPDDASKEFKALVKMAGAIVIMDYANLGNDGYDAFAVFNFLPENKGDASRILSIVITLTEDVNPVGIYDLYQIVNRVNVRIPGGAFVISDDEKTLYYRTYIPLPKKVDDEETLKNVGVRIFEAVSCVTDWIDVLMGLNDGNMTYDTCVERLNG